MAKTKKTKFIILGFLLEKSRSGYEIGQIIQQSTHYFWQESDASIYPTLKVLTREGLASSEAAYVGKRRKEVFTITDTGRKAFQEWFKRPPEPDIHREEFLLKLFFTTEETREEMERHFERKLDEMKEAREKFKQIEEFLKQNLPEKTYWLKTLQVGLAHLEVDIAWLYTNNLKNREFDKKGPQNFCSERATIADGLRTPTNSPVDCLSGKQVNEVNWPEGGASERRNSETNQGASKPDSSSCLCI